MAAITVGNDAIDRATYSNIETSTYIDVNNAADGNGKITTIEIWAYYDMTGVKVGLFSGSGTSYTNRNVASLGSITKGAKRTFSVDLDVVAGDFLGIYVTEGYIERTSSGEGYYVKSGDQFGTGSQTYALFSDRTISLGGSGSTVSGPIKMKTFNGLSNLKIKTINGLPVAKWKTINGLT